MFDNPQGIAVNQATGDLYVRDRDNRRVQQFSSSGGFVRSWGTTGAGAGQFAASTTASNGIAVAPGSGDVFVADPGNRRVQQFKSDGDFLRAWGWGVDTGASAFEICTSASTCQSGLTTPGTNNGRFGSNQPIHIAADSAGIVYASDSNSSGRVMRFDTTQATAAALLLSPIGVPPLISTVTTSMEVDPSNDHLLISRANLGIQVLDTTTLEVVNTHMSGSTWCSLTFSVTRRDQQQWIRRTRTDWMIRAPTTLPASSISTSTVPPDRPLVPARENGSSCKS